MKPSNSTNHARYLVKSLVHASQVLEAFGSRGELLRLRDITKHTGLKSEMCFRMLYTLCACGLVEKAEGNSYRRLVSPLPRRKYHIGYIGPGRGTSFLRQVLEGLQQACLEENLQLSVLEDRQDRDLAIRNADRLIKEGVDLAVEFHLTSGEDTASIIASKFHCAGIPVIAIDIPLPGATYFGANNYEAGLLGGRCLGHYAREHWQRMADEILMIEYQGPFLPVHIRVQGMLAGIREVLANSKDWPVFSIRIPLSYKYAFKATLERVRNHLCTCTAKRILVGAASGGPEALGALRAFQEVRREADCAIVAQDADPEARAEMRQPRTRIIGNVAYFPEWYGQRIVRLAIDILSRRPTPHVVFTKHKLLTPQNLDDVYPHDGMFT